MTNTMAIPYYAELNDSIGELLHCCPTAAQIQLGENVRIKKFSKGEVFISKGDSCNGIYIVLEGAVKLFVEGDNGKKILLFKGSKDVIGLQLAMNDGVFDYYASAMTSVVLAYVPIDQLKKLMALHPNSFFSLIKKIDQKANLMENHSALMMTANAEKIVLKTINELYKKFGTDPNGYLKIRISVKDLASYVGLSKTSLYRVLQSLKEQSILSHYLNRYRLEKNVLR